MNQVKIKIIFFILCFSVLNLSSQNFWSQLSKTEYNQNQKNLLEKKNFPVKYELISLDLNSLKSTLKVLSKNSKRIIELPNSEGTLNRFEIKESSNLEIELQEKFPGIKSYTAKGIDDPSAIAKISLGVDGFHGVVYSNNHSTIYIDPYTKNRKDYIVYERKDLPEIDNDFECKVKNNVKSNLHQKSLNKFVNDGKLRTYRIAIVCSGEYAQFHLNRQNIDSNSSDEVKKAAVLSAMNTSMTRINGVFEKDLGVKMVIVENNDKIIFLDSTTDNITDGNPNVMISQVQSICDSQIGNLNYDIGHIFSIGGSGLASLGVVCQTGSKARGVTGRAFPEGDPYDIDYVAHELGHQFGATHTQNNSCNRTNSTAVEVGSGSTIMGYAGICSPNVLGVGPSTGSSDDYFHAVSIAQMQQIVNSTGDCAELTDTNNATPTADAGLDYNIPKSTPFKLTGQATDSDGLSSLSYNWEQIDNEIGSMPPSSTNSQGPMFRSLPSKSVTTRYFPDITTVLEGNNSSTWEVLPSVSRDLNFAFTVRDNNEGGGSTARDDMKVIVTNSNPFVVTSQQNNVVWDTGSSETITWNVEETNIAPINCSFVNIKLSKDGGLTFPILLKSNTPNDGSEVVVIPDEATENGRIMIEAVDNIFYNVNAGNIIVNSTTPTFLITTSTETNSACNSGNESVNYIFEVDFLNGFSENVSFSASGQPQGSQITFNPNNINSDRNVVMTLSNFDGLPSSDYTINVKGTSNSVMQNIDVTFKLTTSSFDDLNLISPSNNATDIELTAELLWEEDVNATQYDVEVSTDSSFNNIIDSGYNLTSTSFTTNVLNQQTTYYWRVRPKNTCGIGNYSSPFSFTTEACDICDSIGNTEYDTSTTFVKFNTISNSSTKNDDNNVRQGYFDYTSISTNVNKDETYDLTVNVNTDGNYRVQVKVWIDWDGNCEFNSDDEEYDLGYAINNSNGATNGSPYSITIPNDAKLGNTIMRVSSKYTSSNQIVYPTSCELSFDGEVEDYTIIIEEETASLEDELVFSNFNLYPNPNTGEFLLKFDKEFDDDVILELYDIKGRLIEKKRYKNSFSLFSQKIFYEDVNSGLYMLKIKNGKKQTTRKIIIY